MDHSKRIGLLKTLFISTCNHGKNCWIMELIFRGSFGSYDNIFLIEDLIDADDTDDADYRE